MLSGSSANLGRSTIVSDGHAVKTEIHSDTRNGNEPLATFLGLFSIGLGLWELTAPRQVADATGVHQRGLIQAYGARELAAGIGILSTRQPAGWLWSRVAGDVLDLATLGAAYAESTPATRQRSLIAAGAVLGVTVLDIVAACGHERN
jgi:hypothetical protein